MVYKYSNYIQIEDLFIIVSVFNKTIIQLAIVGHEMINSYAPCRLSAVSSL